MTGAGAEAGSSLAVIGGGAWGTALAVLLADRHAQVRLWAFEADLVEEMGRSRENAVYLPGIRIPERVRITASLETALAGSSLALFVVPSHVFRSILESARPHLNPGMVLVSATKGIEVRSLATMSRIMEEILPAGEHLRLAVLSGPSFAREVALRRPTAVVAAARDGQVARAVQQAVSGETLRVYAGVDPVGVELGGAIKNVIAIAAGIVDGLALGTNARAALITRGLAEMTRLGVAMGARPQTFAGLAGMGDLILTCTGDLSRNRSLGLALGRGASLESRLAGSRAVAEGVNTCRSVVALAERHGVDMPISRAVHRVLFQGQAPAEAAHELMARELRFEDE